VVIAADSLEQGAAWCAGTFGVQPSGGGHSQLLVTKTPLGVDQDQSGQHVEDQERGEDAGRDPTPLSTRSRPAFRRIQSSNETTLMGAPIFQSGG
jgi:hypothetical protein